jgi:endonuclease/exonuclease/phosphatase (EEP) superfamily protein YafD
LVIRAWARVLILSGSFIFVTACSTFPFSNDEFADTRLGNHPANHVDGIEACSAVMEDRNRVASAELDSADIDLVVWNIEKGKNSQWADDLIQSVASIDLALFQEAPLSELNDELFNGASYWSFSPGYRTPDALTGVMTISSVEPLMHCNLIDHEPWLRSPKATSITEYELTDTDETLIVVNIHAINFTLGIDALTQQLEKIRGVVARHDGPVILAGDFNTWSTGRKSMVDEFVSDLELTEVSFEIDQRKKYFGSVVDFVFVRGLTVQDAVAPVLESSDHNPLLLKLRM